MENKAMKPLIVVGQTIISDKGKELFCIGVHHFYETPIKLTRILKEISKQNITYYLMPTTGPGRIIWKHQKSLSLMLNKTWKIKP